LTEEMIYNKVKEETAGEIKKLETTLLVEKEISKKMDERTANKYEEQLNKMDIQLDRYKKQLDAQACQLRTYELENKDVINEIVKKEKEKYDLLLDAKEKRIDKIQEVNEQIKEALIKLTHKSTSHKGSTYSSPIIP
jgi:DNA anti-recombination protein RmuC